MAKWRAQNICIILFYDDGCFGAPSFKECENASRIILSDLIKAHILPSAEKSSWKPVKQGLLGTLSQKLCKSQKKE